MNKILTQPFSTFLRRRRVLRRFGRPALLDTLTGQGPVQAAPESLARDLLHPTARPGPARGYYYQLASSIGWTSLPRLPRLQQPTLILAGDDDPIIPLVNARIMHRLIPRSELHIYHGGHLDLATDAEHLAPVVEAFLTAETETPLLLAAEKRLGPLDGWSVLLFVDECRRFGEVGGAGAGGEVACEATRFDAPLGPLREQAERHVGVVGRQTAAVFG